jgi:hypothetical protein
MGGDVSVYNDEVMTVLGSSKKINDRTGISPEEAADKDIKAEKRENGQNRWSRCHRKRWPRRKM